MSTTNNTRKVNLSDSDWVALLKELRPRHCKACKDLHDVLENLMTEDGEFGAFVATQVPLFVSEYKSSGFYPDHVIGPALQKFWDEFQKAAA